ncbi:MAG: putative sigma-54 modulation protein [Thermotogaceae bacterium]|jgi:putative sigma-54 modulation protein|nr:putative sigma-54 modulation protein [Thermotogaceae bacterium]
MDYRILTKGLELSDSLKEYLDKRISKVDRIVDNVVSSVVKLSKETRGREIVEITLHVGNTIIRVEETTNDIYSSIDAAIDSLVRRLKKYKESRQIKKVQKSEIELPAQTEYTEYDEVNLLDKIVKTKRFFMKPMTLEEALLQLELLGHSFFVFRNAETDEINVVYVRKDGNYGLIEFEM